MLNWDLIKKVDPYEKTKLADTLDCKTYNSGDIIIKKGDNESDIYIVEKGEVIAVNA